MNALATTLLAAASALAQITLPEPQVSSDKNSIYIDQGGLRCYLPECYKESWSVGPLKMSDCSGRQINWCAIVPEEDGTEFARKIMPTALEEITAQEASKGRALSPHSLEKILENTVEELYCNRASSSHKKLSTPVAFNIVTHHNIYPPDFHVRRQAQLTKLLAANRTVQKPSQSGGRGGKHTQRR